MSIYDEYMDFFFENIRKIVFPEEWIKLDTAMSKHEMMTLMIIDRHGEIIMSQLSGSLNMPMSTATGIIDRLIKKKYIERMRDEKDRRIVVIKLTDKGRELISEIKGTIGVFFQNILGTLTEEEKTLAFGLIKKVIEQLGKTKNNDPEIDPSKGLKKITIE